MTKTTKPKAAKVAKEKKVAAPVAAPTNGKSAIMKYVSGDGEKVVIVNTDKLVEGATENELFLLGEIVQIEDVPYTVIDCTKVVDGAQQLTIQQVEYGVILYKDVHEKVVSEITKS